jgi:nitric oxide reductase activation protein
LHTAQVHLTQLRTTLQAWLCLLGSLSPPLRPITVSNGQCDLPAPRILENGLCLPAQLDAHSGWRHQRYHMEQLAQCQTDTGQSGNGTALPDPTNWYLAASAHAAAHLLYSRHRYNTAGVPPITQVLLNLLEDARVEQLATRELPGLRRLWHQWHAQAAYLAQADDASLDALLRRLAHVLIDPAVNDPHPWVRKGHILFMQRMREHHGFTDDPVALRQLASELGNDLGQMRRALNPHSYRPLPLYRDDNHWLWYRSGTEQTGACPPPAQPRHHAAPSPQPAAPAQARYPEWDARIGRLRRNWCSVHLCDAPAGATRPTTPSHLTQMLAHTLRNIRPGWLTQLRQHRLHHEGDAMHLDAAVQVSTQRRSGHASALPIFTRQQPGASHAALVLVDHSASTAALLPQSTAERSTILATHQYAAAALLAAMQQASWRSAAYGFCSDGRHAVRVSTIKTFDAPFDLQAQQRLDGLQSGYSTRLGAALRHVGTLLGQRPESQRLLIVLGDTDVHDIDIYQPHYLAHDARHALRALRSQGVRVVCLCAAGDDAAALDQLWGTRQWQRLQYPEQLPLAMRNILGG